MTIEVKNDEMLGRTNDNILYTQLIKLTKEKQELIDYLKEEINKVSEQIRNYNLWHEVGTDINFLILRKQMFKEILNKIEKR